MRGRVSFPCMDRLPDWLVMAVAKVLWIGDLKPAPGTLGALAGTVFYAVALQDASNGARLFAIVFMLAVGWIFCDEAEKRIGETDPGCVVFDEFAVMPIVFLGLATPAGVTWRLSQLFAGFAIFRVFDIAKPFGISRIQDLPGGLGIMADDVVAAVASCAVLHLVTFAAAYVV
jgi:phosphatidylglycerophosphatase A